MGELISLESIGLQLYTDEEVRKLSVVQVTNPSTYDRGLPKANGVNDPRMGVTDKALQCPTCGLTSTCNNHYGYIELEKPVLRLGHIASALCLLRSVCWACSRPKFHMGQKDGFVDIRAIVARTPPGSKDRIRGISEACKNRFRCPWFGENVLSQNKRQKSENLECGAPQPIYSRVNKVFLGRSFRSKENSLFVNDEEREYANRRLLPDEIKSIIRHIPYDALRLLGYKPEISHPENYVFSAQLVPPPSVRPATAASSTEARLRGENDLTSAFQDLVRANNELQNFVALHDEAKIQVAWDKVQIFCAAIINQNAKKLNTFNGTTVVHARAMGKRKTKVIKDRLTGKKGRLRGNLSGKRVDQAGRTVVGPDSSHDIFQLGVPSSIMRTLTFPEHVNASNVKMLSEMVVRGAGNKLGALTVRHPDAFGDEKVLYLSLLDVHGRTSLASQLKPGWTVERHLKDGDWVLFNRQPSLHKASIMAFRAYEINSMQFKLPLPCTKPFNADFDGDEMNIHALQDYKALAEAQEIMSVPNQMVSPQNNSVLIALVQDSIVGAYQMTRRDALVNAQRASQLVMCIHYDSNCRSYSEMPFEGSFSFGVYGLPQPAILKGTMGGKVVGPLWTGKQLFSMLFPKSLSMARSINGADVKNLENVVSCKHENVLNIYRGEFLGGRLCKQTVGTSSGGIVQELWKKNGPWSAAKFVSDAQRILIEWLRLDTVCISIRDCLTPCDSMIDTITADAMGKVDDLEHLDVPRPIKEVRQSQILQETLRTVGATVLENMNMNSGIATVVASGSKGNLMNIAQIAGLVGQQTINGARIAFRNGPLGKRTLANFAPDDNSPEARGFVATSYMMGLQPSEFFFHQQAGREGVVATAVSTADTGYNQRRMVKNQESEVVAYDYSVRVSSNLIVQLHYGGDDYDGTMVERVKIPILLDEEFFRKDVWLKEAYQSLLSINKSGEVSMPVNFAKLATSMTQGRVGNSFAKHEKKKEKASTTRVLKKLLFGMIQAHHPHLFKDEQTTSFWTLEDFLFWRRRNWLICDDPSLQARLCVSLQCTSNFIDNIHLYKDEEEELIRSFLTLYVNGFVNPGEGVGAVGSSSIGEPSMQMTLNIFHYSGIAEKNVTLTGLPRFKQIINAVDNYDSANMTLRFHKDTKDTLEKSKKLSSNLVRVGLSHVAKSSRVEKVSWEGNCPLYLLLAALTEETFDFMKSFKSQKTKKSRKLSSKKIQVSDADSKSSQGKNIPKAVVSRISSLAGKSNKDVRLSSYIALYELDKSAMLSRGLHIDNIGMSLTLFLGPTSIVTWSASWENNWLVCVQPPTWGSSELDRVVTEAIRDALLEYSAINGVESVKKAVSIENDGERVVETEGSDILAVAMFRDIDPLTCTTNNIQEVGRVLGVEAALALMQYELHRVLSFDGSYVDPRHTWLLSDTVARSGVINPLNRHKMEELGGSLLQCASFEQTLDVFEHGAAFGKSDSLGGATEKLIVGQPVHVGTGSFAILTKEEDDEAVCSTFVAPLEIDRMDMDMYMHKDQHDRSPSEDETRVRPLQRNQFDTSKTKTTESKTLDECVFPLRNPSKIAPQISQEDKAKKKQYEYEPPHELSSEKQMGTKYLEICHKLSDVVNIMRKGAQLREAVWISCDLIAVKQGTKMIKKEFQELETSLESYCGWVERPRLGQYNQFTEVEYSLGEHEIVSRVDYSAKLANSVGSGLMYPTSNQHPTVLRTSHKRKEEMFKTDLPSISTKSWNATCSAVSWKEVNRDSLPTTVIPRRVHVRQEKLFQKGSWSTRLSKIWSGINILEAEQLQRGGSTTCVFQISIELEKPWELLEQRGSTDFAIAASFVERILSCTKIMT